MGNIFQKAKREQIWVKVLLAGPSGSGKTYTALRLATGISGRCGSRIAAIDTENGRIRYYAGEFDFDDLQLESPFTPEKYIEAIDSAIDAGYKIIVVDSSTHEWDYCLDQHSKMAGNSYTNWAKITPRHDAFIEKILQSDAHVIVTVRGKDEYVLEEKNGKQTPQKVGLGYKQRDGIEYNYTATFNIAQDTHVATVTKDNTHLFEGTYNVLTEKDGERIYDWANTGDVRKQPKQARPTYEPASETVESLIAQIKDEVDKQRSSGVDTDTIGATIKAEAGTANYNKIADIAIAQKVLKALKGE